AGEFPRPAEVQKLLGKQISSLRLDSPGRAALSRSEPLSEHQAENLLYQARSHGGIPGIRWVSERYGPRDALRHASTMVEAHPRSDAARVLLVHLLCEAGRREEAVLAARAALRDLPDRPFTHLALWRLEEDARHLENALRFGPDEPACYRIAAHAHVVD